MNDDLRIRKVAAVEGLLGSTIFEPFEFLTVTLLSFQLYSSLSKRYSLFYKNDQSLSALSLQSLALCLPYILFLLGINFFIIAFVLLGLIFWTVRYIPANPKYISVNSEGNTKLKDNINSVSKVTNGKIPYLIPLRAYLMLTTVSAILAVDFPAFPREFAKTEISGYSVMDLGVGLFIFSAGIVVNTKPNNRQKSAWPFIKACLMVGLIGAIRTIVVKVINYQEHEGEYGKHWNFFITLTVVPILGYIVRRISQLTKIDTRFFAGAFALLYEYFLQTTYLHSWLISNGERKGLIESNKEGIFSCVGYLAIYLYAMGLNAKLPLKGTFKTFTGVFRHFYILTIISLLYLIRLEPSRRLANSAYSLWVIWSSLYHLIGCIFITVATGRSTIEQQPYLFKLVNRHQLLIFLLGNIFTGLVNITFDVFNTNRLQAVLVISLYTYGLVVIAHFYNRNKKLD